MCLIVDANAASLFLAKPSAIRTWLGGATGEPRLVTGGRLTVEFSRVGEVRAFLVQLERAGRLRRVDQGQLGREEQRLRGLGICRSDDLHVLALGTVSGARTLATFDAGLAADFGNASIISRPPGKVYRYPVKHGHLLRHTPTSCGVKDRRKGR